MGGHYYKYKDGKEDNYKVKCKWVQTIKASFKVLSGDV